MLLPLPDTPMIEAMISAARIPPPPHTHAETLTGRIVKHVDGLSIKFIDFLGELESELKKEELKKIDIEKSDSEDYTLLDPADPPQQTRVESNDKEIYVYIVDSEEFDSRKSKAIAHAPLNYFDTQIDPLQITTDSNVTHDDSTVVDTKLSRFPNATSDPQPLQDPDIDAPPNSTDTFINIYESQALKTRKHLIDTSNISSVIVEGIDPNTRKNDSPVNRLHLPKPMSHLDAPPPADSEASILKVSEFIVENSSQTSTDAPVSDYVQADFKWLDMQQKAAISSDSYQPSVQPLKNVDRPAVAVTNIQANVPAYASLAEDRPNEDKTVDEIDSRSISQPYIERETPLPQRGFHYSELEIQKNIATLINPYPLSPINSKSEEETLAHEPNHSIMKNDFIKNEELKTYLNLLSTLPNDTNSAIDPPQDDTSQPAHRAIGGENSPLVLEAQRNYKLKLPPTLSITQSYNLKPEELGLLSIHNQYDGKNFLTNLKNIGLSHLIINDTQIPTRDNMRNHIEYLPPHDPYSENNSGSGEWEQGRNQGLLSVPIKREKADRGRSAVNSEPDDVEICQKVKGNRLDIII